MFNLKRKRNSPKLFKVLAVLLCIPLLVNGQMVANGQTLKESRKVYSKAHSDNDLFGFGTAVYKNRILVGALKQDHQSNGPDTGAAYVYRLEEGQWEPELLQLPKDLNPNDGFGGKVAMYENIAAVGAIGHDGMSEDGGIVFLYQRFDNTWREVTRIFASDSQTGDSFGQSIAMSQDTLVIGAPKDDDNDYIGNDVNENRNENSDDNNKGNGKDSGSVYVYSKKGDNWTLEQKLTAPDGAAGDVFGISVAISHKTILIGADLNDEKANNAGAAYVYIKQGKQWIYQSKLMADDAGDTDIFGVRVSLDGDTALISARRDDDDIVGKDSGSAYVFRRKGNSWYQEAKLTGPTQQADDRFGRSVALVGNTALIGAMHKDYAGGNAGAAYLFTREGNKWRHTRTLTASDGAPGDQLGWSAALTSDYAVVSAAKHAPKSKKSGAVYIFEVNVE